MTDKEILDYANHAINMVEHKDEGLLSQSECYRIPLNELDIHSSCQDDEERTERLVGDTLKALDELFLERYEITADEWFRDSPNLFQGRIEFETRLRNIMKKN